MPKLDVPRRRADRLHRGLRQPAAHQGLAQRDEDRHARGAKRPSPRSRRAAPATSSTAYPEAFAQLLGLRGPVQGAQREAGPRSGACGPAPRTAACTCGSTTSASARWSPGRCVTARPTTKPAARGGDAAHRLPEARRRADLRPAVVGVPVRTPATRRTSRSHLHAARSVGARRRQPRALRRPGSALLPGGRLRVRAGRGRRRSACRSTRRTACTARPATSRTRRRTSTG